MIRSATAHTDNIDSAEDLAQVAKDLAREIKKKLPLAQNSCGVLFCDIDFVEPDFVNALAEEFPFPIIGASSLATITASGYHNFSAQLTVLTSDDCNFSTVATNPLTAENYREEVSSSFYQAQEKLGDFPAKAIFLFSPLIPLTFEQSEFAPLLSELSGGLPVFGGAASDYMDFTHYKTIYNDQIYSDRLVILLAGGDIRPVFSVNDQPSVTGAFGKVTQAEGCIIKTVDGQPFTEYCRSSGFKKNLDIIARLYIIRAKYFDADGRSYYINRTVQSIDEETGSALCSAPIPDGAEISLCVVTRSDIAATAQNGIDDLNRQIAENQTDGYQYSTIFAFSCALRHMILAHDAPREGQIIKDSLISGIEVTGFYTLGEFAPVFFLENGEKSRFLNCTLVLCAI